MTHSPSSPEYEGARLANWLADYSQDLMEEGDFDQEAAELAKAAQWIADHLGAAQRQQEPDYKSCFFDTLKMLNEALDVIENIDSECLLPSQLQDLVDVALAPRRGQQTEPLPAAPSDTSEVPNDGRDA